MKKVFSVFLLFISLSSTAQNKQSVSIIPQPVSLQTGAGAFVVKNGTSIEVVAGNAESNRTATYLSKALSIPTGYSLPVKTATSSKANGSIQLSLVSAGASDLGKEGYRLTVAPAGVSVAANTPAGLFYGVQTLLQLLPKEIESKAAVKNIQWSIPAVTITDYPRFGWRGMMLDVSRHFFTKEEVKDFIDDMVKYKFNLLHLHLTDDQGWRIEIKSLPNLTKTGAWRVKREGKWGNTTAPGPDEPRNYGGFYTQEDIKELVQYAKDRFVNILPEIDVPGHSMAAIASYPELTCTPGNQQVNAGERFMEWHSNGHFSALVDNNLCPAHEAVYSFLDKVFTEVAQLFPFEYIHMGGDEAAKNMWEKSDTIKALMKKEGLKNMEEVQSYFVKRVEKIIQSKGKKLMGWDEILEGGIAPNASVMSWRGMKGGITAAKMGHQVVMSPTDFVYLDYMQGDAYVEAPVYASLRLNQTYKFDPVPEGIDAKMILGGQGNLWTEQLANLRAVQYMIWPRALAVAESVWSPKEKKNWPDFISRVENEFQRMDIAQTRYARSMYDPIFKATLDSTGNNKTLKVVLETEVPGLDIHYSFDESNPDNFYPKYTSALIIPKDAVHLKVITYRNGIQMGKQINMPVAELERRGRRR